MRIVDNGEAAASEIAACLLLRPGPLPVAASANKAAVLRACALALALGLGMGGYDSPCASADSSAQSASSAPERLSNVPYGGM